MDIMDETSKIDQLLDSFFTALGEELYAILVIQRDKKVVAQKVKSGIDISLKEEISKIPTSKMLIHIIDSGMKEFGTLAYRTAKMGVIIGEIGEESILVFITSSGAASSFFFPYIFLCAEKIQRIILNRDISLVIPKFERLEDQASAFSEFNKISLEKKGNFWMKFILGGDNGVGKTTMVENFVYKTLGEKYKSTIGINIMSKKTDLPQWNSKLEFAIYDLGGQTIYKEVRKKYYLGASAGFIVYDVTKPETLENVREWYQEIKSAEPNILLFLVGNKIDLDKDRKITPKQGEALAHELGMQYIETNALNKDIVDEAFSTLAVAYLLRKTKVTQNEVEIKKGWVF
jgi:small GTP-binding protein